MKSLLKNPTKSLSDKKEYKYFQLQNGLKVLLIKQQESDKNYDDEAGKDKKHKSNLAAVAMCVASGCFQDDIIQGISHLLEHMIFMGSQKYPKENEFDQFCSAHSGYDNAYTECEHTLFHFDIIEKHLAGALDRFSQLFISTLMSLDSMQREIIAVESEFQNNLNDDDVRLSQIYLSMIYDRHRAANFIWGNLKTLKEGIDGQLLHKKLHEFKVKNYTADKMFLCIQSGLEISRLERSVVNFFSEIPSGSFKNILQIPNDPFEIFKPDFYEKMYFVKSTSEKCKLLMTFVFSTATSENKFLEYLASLIQYEGPGSLSDYFMDEMLALKIKARVGYQNYEGNSLYTFFTIDVNLTSRGFENFDNVLDAIFAFLLLLKSTKIDEHETRYNEFREIKEILFKYQKEKSAIENVQEIAVNMNYYKDDDILIGKSLFPDFNSSVMKDMINKINEHKFNLLILSDKYCKNYEMREKWFGTEYAIVELPFKYKSLWNERWLRNELYLPATNKFICKNFGIFNNPSEKDENYPRKIFKNENCECFYKMDKTYKLPYGYIYIYFVSPLTQLSTENLNMTSIYSMCVKNFLSEKLYPATLVGYNYKLNSVDTGLILRLNGFNEKLPSIIEIIVKEMKKKIEKTVFETFKKELKKNCYNCMMDLNVLNDDYRLSIIKQNHRSFFERYKQIDSIKYSDFKVFAQKILLHLEIKVLIQGNIVESRALFIKELILANIKAEKIDENVNDLQVFELPIGSRSIKAKSMRINDHNSIVKNYYQAQKGGIRTECLTEFLVSILTEPLFNILRTNEQIGYGITCSSTRKNNGIIGITITVEYQENHNTADVIDQKIEEFLQQYQSEIGAISSEEFITAKRCFLSSKLSSDTDLENEVNRNFDEMRNNEYIFNRKDLEAKEVESITKEEIFEFYKNVFISTESVRKLSVQITGVDNDFQLMKPNCHDIKNKINENIEIVRKIIEVSS